MPMVRHFLLKVNAPEAARKPIECLVSGDEADAPQSLVCVNVARMNLGWEGLARPSSPSGLSRAALP